MLSETTRAHNKPWMVAGDFNEVVGNNEKMGGFVIVTILGSCGFYSQKETFPNPSLVGPLAFGCPSVTNRERFETKVEKL